MNSQEFSISVNIDSGSPVAKVKGAVDVWRGQALEDVVEGFLLHGMNTLTLDVSQALFGDIESVSMLIRTLRAAASEAKITMVANPSTVGILSRACLGENVILRSCTDAVKLAQPTTARMEYLTSRCIARKAGGEAMPLAA